MKEFIHTSIEGLFDFIKGNPDDSDETTYKEKHKFVITWFILVSLFFSLFLVLTTKQ